MTAAAPAPMRNISQPLRLNQIFRIREDTSTSYTFAQIDAGCQRDLNNAGAVTATIPPNSSVAFDIGTVLYGRQKGAGAVSVTAGAGVTFTPASPLTLRTQGSYFAAIKVATDTWAVCGDFVKGSNRTIASISSPTTAAAVAGFDYAYFVSGTTTLTMPTAVGNTSRYAIKNSGSNTVSIGTTSSQTIDGGAAPITLSPGQSVDLISDNSNWWVV